ncbi:MAG: pyridoxine 5'-phosphate synthase [Helicobacteraceae bacterium]|nr:pyridoxine 5'-phosphate synthase [Helicobacteraceae bacterium]
MTLGVNIDHIAVLREARKINDPDPLMALAICAQNGADQITIHLREDRRHIQDADCVKIIQSSSLPVNLECAIDQDIIDIMCELKPHRVTLVPEKREEVTTEGGLDLKTQNKAIAEVIAQLKQAQIDVSLFIDPTIEMIELSSKLGADMVELHTGMFANIYAMLNSSLPYSHHAIEELKLPRHILNSKLEDSLNAIEESATRALELNLEVAAGHGLNYQNVSLIRNIQTISELNIGQSIIARSVFTGLATAVSDMKELVK